MPGASPSSLAAHAVAVAGTVEGGRPAAWWGATTGGSGGQRWPPRPPPGSSAFLDARAAVGCAWPSLAGVRPLSSEGVPAEGQRRVEGPRQQHGVMREERRMKVLKGQGGGWTRKRGASSGRRLDFRAAGFNLYGCGRSSSVFAQRVLVMDQQGHLTVVITLKPLARIISMSPGRFSEDGRDLSPPATAHIVAGAARDHSRRRSVGMDVRRDPRARDLDDSCRSSPPASPAAGGAADDGGRRPPIAK